MARVVNRRTRPLLTFLATLIFLLFLLQPNVRGLTQQQRVEYALTTIVTPSKRYIIQLEDGDPHQFLAQQAAWLPPDLAPVFVYQHVFPGLALDLTGEMVNEIARLPQVAAVYPDSQQPLLTDASPEWVGATAVWSGEAGPPSHGAGVIIGVIDTGLNFDHPSFADIGGDGYDHQNPWGSGTYAGVCDPDSGVYNPDFACNDKVIGGWDFVDGASENDGPEDSDGHGSQVAGTAAGNILSATLTHVGFQYETILSGIAPHANLVVYDACADTCPVSAVLAAIDQAIQDDVDVLNVAIAGGAVPYHDPIELALLEAVGQGVFVAAPAGSADIGWQHQGAWVATAVAATHQRRFHAVLSNLAGENGSLPDITGKGLTENYGPASLVYAGDFGDPTCAAPFQAGTWANGEIVICDFLSQDPTNQGTHILSGGGGGIILIASELAGQSFPMLPQPLPVVQISHDDGRALKAWLATGSNQTAVINQTSVQIDPLQGDRLAGFNPSHNNWSQNILKPDLTAPGVDILAATRSILPLAAPEYDISNGTSLAAAHIAGGAALLRTLHPTWTPAEIRSALMLTAVPAGLRGADGNFPAPPQERGSGRIDLAAAAATGLVMNETYANYVAAEGGDLNSLNLPALLDGQCFDHCSWTRVLRNTTSENVTWSASFETSAPLSISINPPQFLVGPQMTQTVTISVDVTQLPSFQGWALGTVVLANESYPPVQLPLAVQKAGTNAPRSLMIDGKPIVQPGQLMTVTIALDNLDRVTNTFTLTSTLPPGVAYIPGSNSGGLVYDPRLNQLTWQGDIGPGTLGYETEVVYPPLSYINLPDLDPTLTNLCDLFADCDEVVVDVDLAPESISFYDETVTQIGISANGILLGPLSDLENGCHPCPQLLPQPAAPNQVIAGLWRDMDASGSGGQWYTALLDGLIPGERVLYANWHDVGQWGDALLTSRHAIAIPLQDGFIENGRIYFIYDDISDRERLLAHGFTAGVEDGAGVEGLTLAHAPCAAAACSPGPRLGQPPANQSTWQLEPAIVGGSSARIFSYQLLITADAGTMITNQVQARGSGSVPVMTAVSDTIISYRQHLPLLAR